MSLFLSRIADNKYHSRPFAIDNFYSCIEHAQQDLRLELFHFKGSPTAKREPEPEPRTTEIAERCAPLQAPQSSTSGCHHRLLAAESLQWFKASHSRILNTEDTGRKEGTPADVNLTIQEFSLSRPQNLTHSCISVRASLVWYSPRIPPCTARNRERTSVVLGHQRSPKARGPR